MAIDGALTRRRMFLGIGGGVMSLVAGCAALSDNDPPDDLSYSQLHLTAVYVDEDVALPMPDEVPTVGAANNADLLILPDDTDVEAHQAVHWLAEERVLSLIGPNAEPTWFDWARSDAFDDTFDEGGYADGEPDPSLLVAAKVGLNVPTYRHSWSGTPRDRDLLRALDEDLVDIEAKTPQ